MTRTQKSLKERLVAFVEVEPDGCWRFTGCCLKNGYGCINGGNHDTLFAHRVAWTVFRGPIPNGLFVCHTCDHRYCVNPEHLFLGTAKDNSQDMASKGRSRNEPHHGEKNGNAKLTFGQVSSIRQRKREHQKTLAAEFGCSVATVNNIIRGKTWRFGVAASRHDRIPHRGPGERS